MCSQTIYNLKPFRYPVNKDKNESSPNMYSRNVQFVNKMWFRYSKSHRVRKLDQKMFTMYCWRCRKFERISTGSVSVKRR